jgi:glutamyl-tRNA synthetase
MALLGWSPGEDREIYLTREELIHAFRIEGISKSNSVFNYRPGDPKFFTDPKAIHVNAQHIRLLPVEVLAGPVAEVLAAAGIWDPAWADGGPARRWFTETLELIRVRYHLLTDFTTLGRAFFAEDYELEAKAFAKSVQKDPRLKEFLPALADRFEALSPFDLATTEAALRGLAETLGVQAGLLINATRVAVSGQGVGPGLFDLLVAVGQARTVARLRRVAAGL